MKIIQYVYLDKPDEKEKLKKLFKNSDSEMQLRLDIAREFNISTLDATFVIKRFKDKFIKN